MATLSECPNVTGVDSHALTLQVRVPANIDKSKNVSIVIQKNRRPSATKREHVTWESTATKASLHFISQDVALQITALTWVDTSKSDLRKRTQTDHHVIKQERALLENLTSKL